MMRKVLIPVAGALLNHFMPILNYADVARVA